MRYTFKLRGSRFNKVHLVTGHRVPESGKTEMVSACGLSWRYDTKAWREGEKKRVHPLGRMRGRPQTSIWPKMEEVGVTCEHCIRLGYPPFHRKPSPSHKDTSPPKTPEE